MIAEVYNNRAYANNVCHRYWVDPKIMVGGSIFDAEEWARLRTTYGLGAVINVETEHSDAGKAIEYLCEEPVPDDGTPFNLDLIGRVCVFAQVQLGDDRALYVHCQQGGSRSPAFAYAILRYVCGLTEEAALWRIREGKGEFSKDYGNHRYHKAYLTSVESSLAGRKFWPRAP